MAIVPDFKLYDSTGTSLVYTFPVVFDTNIPQTPSNAITIEGLRGKGGIILDGGTALFEIYLHGVLITTDYEALTVLIDALESAVPIHTAFKLRLDKTASTYYEYNVKRIKAIEYPIDNQDVRNTIQEYTIYFSANSW
jgi:hypothetical protein